MKNMHRIILTIIYLLSLSACSSMPQTVSLNVVNHTHCSSCAEWNAPRKPVLIHGNTYYVGTTGLSAILITSPQGHVLIDGALRESAPLIKANIEQLGFYMKDIKYILNSHAHFDHAGGLAELQRTSGAKVAASPSSAEVMKTGRPGPEDPQYSELLPYPISPIRNIHVLSDGETIQLGPLTLTAHFTPGHTAGGTTWTWYSCENNRCLNMVYADSLTAVSEKAYRFSKSERYPSVLADFDKTFRTVETLPCDILITPHPGASRLFERINENALIDSSACIRYTETARQRLAERLESEKLQSTFSQ